MTWLHLFGWLVGITCLLYFLSAMLRPDWFIGGPVPRKQRGKLHH
ncbi:MAG: hypothetical protein R2932_49430 [Caldilineaceae bacterium]